MRDGAPVPVRDPCKTLHNALEPPETSPERSGTTQDNLKRVSITQDPPVWPPRRPVRPPRRHVVCPGLGSRSVCLGSNFACLGSICERPGNTNFIEIILKKKLVCFQATLQLECDLNATLVPFCRRIIYCKISKTCSQDAQRRPVKPPRRPVPPPRRQVWPPTPKK